jgi:hypothetical protein
MALGAASVIRPGRGARSTHHCGRGGAGAVLGSKRIKAIVLDAGPGAAANGAPEGAEPTGSNADPRVAASPYREACGIEDPLVLERLEALQDDLGVDGAEVAAAVSLAMEAGLARHGDGQAAVRLVEEIGRWTPLGRIVGSGVRAMAEAFGLEPRMARWCLQASPAPGPVALRALAAAEAELGRAAPEVVAAERRFLARARAAAAEQASEGDPGVRLHPIVFGAVDEDLARLFGTLDPNADPFDPQLQLPVGLRSPRSAEPAGPARLPGSRHVKS